MEYLLRTMIRRLVLMHDVARWKWNREQPIVDLAREEAFLAAILPPCRAAGLDPEFSRAFFVAQIDAAKRVQEDDFRRWQADRSGKFADVPDLAATLRPQIDAVSRELVQALVAATPVLKEEKARIGPLAQRLAAETILPAAAVETAIRPLLETANGRR